MAHPKYINIGTPFEKLVEECAEVLKAAAKLNRFGADNRHPDGGPTNLQKLRAEWSDLHSAYVVYVSDVIEQMKGGV